MAKSKNRKNHKAKVAKRRTKIEQQKKKLEKQQKEFLMKLIEQEKEKGLFDNNPTIESVNSEDSIDTNEGPTI